MIKKSWKFEGFTSEMPEWIQEKTSKQIKNSSLWVHTQQGKKPAKIGQWISINLRGQLNIHDEKPDNIAKDLMAGVALVVMIAAVLVIMLAI
jgi:hypothetical protein